MKSLFLLLPEGAEALFLFCLIMARIWAFNSLGVLTFFITVGLALIPIISWYAREYHIQKLSRHAVFQKLGLLPADFKKDRTVILLVFLVFYLATISMALKWNPNFIKQPYLDYQFLTHSILYYPWALLQQLWLNGYFVNRLEKVFKNAKITSIAAGALFAIVHAPNPVLLVATFFGGITSAYFFQRNRNLYLLALLHVLLAISIKYFLPMEWHHNIRIGPGFTNWTLGD
ncbi:MAG: hypothetical protein A3B92_02950 [Candidatus Harrisonbacteria bacterium RIFCSPHIGHO2_02_FULL_42_16]|uniref:CAAX prenyl protease 2/Lysostaphin resistance protein A-like domain-containing protein n=1 Tax=Candidatus Harrisonbacteria bacterium RIFCSPHIGHO2_02_FULL_42_16 TaxID=1798404 RepID=A0A1G1ZIV3_9BACT|nr:MAG: hypothetical protein A3B92_02950 [Candidatus Harrisonbacteria bacterium RIFCSPHIGHO2_02_FULL_42_16]